MENYRNYIDWFEAHDSDTTELEEKFDELIDKREELRTAISDRKLLVMAQVYSDIADIRRDIVFIVEDLLKGGDDDASLG